MNKKFTFLDSGEINAVAQRIEERIRKTAIYKYKIESRPGSHIIEMPQGSEILSFQTQNFSLQLWALVNPNLPLVKRKFLICFTGEEIERSPGDFYKYIGTTQDSLVYHLFEKIN